MRRATIERAALWSAVEVSGRNLTQFIVTIILARLLSPPDFGVIAIALFFSSLATLAIQGTISLTLVRSPRTTVEEESALHWLNVALSICFAVALLASGKTIARLFDLPILQSLMIPVALQVAIGGLGTIPGAIMTRAMRFRELAVIGLIANLIGGVVGIIFALANYGPWALAAQIAISIILSAVGCMVYSGWRPMARLHIARVVHHLHFSTWLGLSSLLDLLYLQLSTLLIGKFYGPGPLGVYGRASSLQLLTANIVQGVVGRVSLPVFASRNAEPGKLSAALLASLQLIMFVYVPVMIGISVSARDVILVLFGGQWIAATPFLTVLAIGGSLYPIQLLNEQVLLAQGRSDTVFRLSSFRKTLGIGCILAGSLAGMLGLVWGQFAAMAIGAMLAMTAAGRLSGTGLAEQLRAMWKPFAAAAIMAGILLLVQQQVNLASLGRLIALTAVGAASYFTACLALRFEPALEFSRAARRWAFKGFKLGRF